MDFDAALTSILRSPTEMEKIQKLDEKDFQSVIDVLGQVRFFSSLVQLLPFQFTYAAP